MTTANKVRIGILGASGYTGAELLRLLALHPGVEINEGFSSDHSVIRQRGIAAQVSHAEQDGAEGHREHRGQRKIDHLGLPAISPA